MSLRTKLLIILLVSTLLSGLFAYLALERLVFPSFEEIEVQESLDDLHRVQNAIDREVESLDVIGRDWAFWDDTYDFALLDYDDYIESNLGAATLINVEVNFLLLYDTNGDLLWGEVVDLETEEMIELSNLFKTPLTSDHLIMRHKPAYDENDGLSGLIDSNYGPLILTAQPILPNDPGRPPAGTLIFGRFYEPDLVSEQAQVDFRSAVVNSNTLEPDMAGAVTALSNSAEATVMHVGPDTRFTSVIINDIYDDPYLLVTVSTPQSITQSGRKSIQSGLIALMISGVVSLGILLIVLNKIFFEPLLLLKEAIIEIRESGLEQFKTPSVKSNDEIGVLASEFSGMVDEVTSTRRQLLEYSFKAGQAEVAAGVLHNIRNSLVPLAGNAQIITKLYSDNLTTNLESAIQQIATLKANDERRSKLIDYSLLVVQKVADKRVNLLKRLAVNSKQIDHITAIVAEQEQWAYGDPVIEAVDLENVLNEAARVLPSESDPPFELIHDSSISTIRSVYAHRMTLVQIFSNLLINASESIYRTGQNQGQIILSAEAIEDRAMIQVKVKDNGVGIDPQGLTTVFQRGYSTKQEVKGGLGLHWCANVIASMSGEIRAFSDGQGQGATFVVLLPEAK